MTSIESKKPLKKTTDTMSEPQKLSEVGLKKLEAQELGGGVVLAWLGEWGGVDLGGE